MSEETSQSGDGQFVTENLTQTQNTSKDDETRGFKVHGVHYMYEWDRDTHSFPIHDEGF